MGVFDDKKLEQLDWMTRITETIESEINTILAALPDEVILDQEMLLEGLGNSYGLSVDFRHIVGRLMRNVPNARTLSWEDTNRIYRCFRFEADPDITWDARTNTISGGVIRLVKTVATFEDEDLQKVMGHKGIESLRHFRWNDAPIGRMNEILELLGGCDDAIKNRSSRKKMYRVQHRLQEIFTNNEWRIRDTELADKVGLWIREYIQSGSLAALTNFCKLKVMTHNNMPIYSVEEETI